MRAAEGATPAVIMNYGQFIQNIFDFVIVAFGIFLAIKLMNSMRRQAADTPAAPPAPTTEEKLLPEIRDLLKHQQKSFVGVNKNAA